MGNSGEKPQRTDTDSKPVDTIKRHRAMKAVINDYKQNPPLFWMIPTGCQPGDKIWKVRFTASDNCPFWGLDIWVTVQFPEKFPKQLPILTMQDPHLFYHPNISEKGEICSKIITKEFEDVLEEGQNGVQTKKRKILRSRLDEVSNLLENPNPTNAYNFEAAKQFSSNPRGYHRKAMHTFRKVKR